MFSTVFTSLSVLLIFSFIDHPLHLRARFLILFHLHLTQRGSLDQPICNVSISFDLTQMVSFPTRIPDCDSHSPDLLGLCLSSEASICSTMAFPPLGNFDHIVVSVSIDFPSYLQRDAPFHRIAYDYSRSNWDSFRDHLRDVPWEDIFKLGASAAASEFCEFRRASKYCKRVLEAAKLAYANKTKESITSQKLGF